MAARNLASPGKRNSPSIKALRSAGAACHRASKLTIAGLALMGSALKSAMAEATSPLTAHSFAMRSGSSQRGAACPFSGAATCQASMMASRLSSRPPKSRAKAKSPAWSAALPSAALALPVLVAGMARCRSARGSGSKAWRAIPSGKSQPTTDRVSPSSKTRSAGWSAQSCMSEAAKSRHPSPRASTSSAIKRGRGSPCAKAEAKPGPAASNICATVIP